MNATVDPAPGHAGLVVEPCVADRRRDVGDAADLRPSVAHYALGNERARSAAAMNRIFMDALRSSRLALARREGGKRFAADEGEQIAVDHFQMRRAHAVRQARIEHRSSKGILSTPR